LYDPQPKLDHPNAYPEGESGPEASPEEAGRALQEIDPVFVSSSNQAVTALEERTEDREEGDGKAVEVPHTSNGFELKKLLNEVGKMKASGQSNDAILKHFGLTPGGRNNQNLKLLNDLIVDGEQQESEEAE
jgi:hypothetical protein